MDALRAALFEVDAQCHPEKLAALKAVVKATDSDVVEALESELSTDPRAGFHVVLLNNVVLEQASENCKKILQRMQEREEQDAKDFPLQDEEDLWGYDDFDTAEELVEFVREECGDDVAKLARYKSYR